MFLFLIETSFTVNKHAIPLYKPKPQISSTHSDGDPGVKELAGGRAHAQTTRRHTLSDAVQT